MMEGSVSCGLTQSLPCAKKSQISVYIVNPEFPISIVFVLRTGTGQLELDLVTNRLT